MIGKVSAASVSLLCLVFAMGSCKKGADQSQRIVREYQPFYQPEEFLDGIQTVTMALGDSLHLAPQKLAKNKYGSFYYGRAEYYVIENPSNELMDAKVLRSLLYYFDKELYRVQYIVGKDVSYDLINSLPNFSIVTFNQESRNCLNNEPVVLRLSNGKLMLNPGITDYELRWRGEKNIVKWRCAKSRNYYEYSELNANYAVKFYELEKYQYDLETRFQ